MSNRSDPVAEGDALWRVPSEPGPCTTSSCVERSVTELARPAERHFELHLDRRLLSVARLAHSRTAHAARGVDRPLRTRSHRAQGRAPAPGEPVFAGVPWAYGVEMGECGHVIVSTSRDVRSCSRECQKREIAPPMIARLKVRRGWANAHASGVVHRLVNIGTRLPGRAL